MPAIQDDEVIRLILQTAGVENVEECAAAFSKLKTELMDTKGAGYELEEQTYALVKGMDGDAQAAVNVADLSQEVAKRMREKAEAIDQATRAINDERDAAEALAATVAKNGALVQQGGADFSNLGRQMMDAERAGNALVTGTGLARTGPMLDRLVSSLGGPAGLGMAIGALAFALEGVMPKLKEFFEHWEKGAKKIDAAQESIERLNRASNETRQKRALAKIDSKIKALEDKEDEQGWLSVPDYQDLRKLREASRLKHDEFDSEAGEAKRIKEQKASLEKGRVDAEHATIEADKRIKEKENAAMVKAGHVADAADEKAEKERDARRKRVEKNLDKATNEGVAAELSLDADAEREKHKAKAAAEKAARENTPEAINRRERQAADNQALGLVQANTFGFDAKEQSMIAKHLRGNHEAGLDMAATFEEALSFAIQQTRREIFEGIQRGVQKTYSRIDN